MAAACFDAAEQSRRWNGGGLAEVSRRRHLRKRHGQSGSTTSMMGTGNGCFGDVVVASDLMQLCLATVPTQSTSHNPHKEITAPPLIQSSAPMLANHQTTPPPCLELVLDLATTHHHDNVTSAQSQAQPFSHSRVATPLLQSRAQLGTVHNTQASAYRLYVGKSR
ncbi:hypothetical protein M0R45_000300 [Rubus argutus]|uniref:Uncharacterized protein n=1 Tax=Rubus argutus TaxID=59490 RepID=A0AAW1VRK1_RUBAR